MATRYFAGVFDRAASVLEALVWIATGLVSVGILITFAVYTYQSFPDFDWRAIPIWLAAQVIWAGAAWIIRMAVAAVLALTAWVLFGEEARPRSD